MMFLCNHEWKLLSETITKSKVQHAVEIGMRITTGAPYMLERKHIQTFTCSKCPKLKRYVEEI